MIPSTNSTDLDMGRRPELESVEFFEVLHCLGARPRSGGVLRTRTLRLTTNDARLPQKAAQTNDDNSLTVQFDPQMHGLNPMSSDLREVVV
eukprot:6912556-Prymnesium_polylepis.1